MKINMVTRQVTLKGLRPIMFDRYAGSNKEQLAPMDKVYVSQEDKTTLVMPSINMVSFLSSINAESAPRRLLGKGWGAVAKAALSFVEIDPVDVPFARNGKPLTKDNAGLWVHFGVARMKKGALVIPNPKERPVLPLPWELSFTLKLFSNPDLTESILRKLFDEGGLCIGLGTYRGVFGKFEVAQWE
jgi:hypothetical protein